jgi:hypothetical protein
MENFILQKGPCNFLKLRISPWEIPSVLLLSSSLSSVSFLFFYPTGGSSIKILLFLPLSLPASLPLSPRCAGRSCPGRRVRWAQLRQAAPARALRGRAGPGARQATARAPGERAAPSGADAGELAQPRAVQMRRREGSGLLGAGWLGASAAQARASGVRAGVGSRSDAALKRTGGAEAKRARRRWSRARASACAGTPSQRRRCPGSFPP